MNKSIKVVWCNNSSNLQHGETSCLLVYWLINRVTRPMRFVVITRRYVGRCVTFAARS